MNKRIAMKKLKREEGGLSKEVGGLISSISALQHGVEEIGEDNMRVLQGMRRAAEGQESLRSLMLEEFGRVRADIGSELSIQFLMACCREISPVLNALEGMLAGADFSDADTTRGHVESLAIGLMAAFERMGIERIPVAVGTDVYNSRLHDCVRVCTRADSPFPEAGSCTIVRLLEQGYTIRGRVVSPAKVWVQKAETEDTETEKETNA